MDKLDSFLSVVEDNFKKGCFLKIDVEGFEFPVMQGAKCFLTSLPAVFILFEYSTAWADNGFSLKEAFHFLDQLSFSIFRVTPLGLESLRFYTPAMEGSDYCNYFAVKGADLDGFLEKKTVPSDAHNWNDFYLFP